MIVTIKWSKTIQFTQRKLQLPLLLDADSTVCPIKWLLIMLKRILALGLHNLFSFYKHGVIHPVTYRDLTVQLRQWLKDIGVKDYKAFSSHSLRRGSTSHAFNNNVPENMIKILGDWASDAYKRYIDLTVETRLKAWFLIPNFISRFASRQEWKLYQRIAYKRQRFRGILSKIASAPT